MSVKWTVEWGTDGYDALRNGRSFQFGFDTVAEAVRAIKKSRRYTKTDIILAESKDGNLVRV
jgi:hypothetical protein